MYSTNNKNTKVIDFRHFSKMLKDFKFYENKISINFAEIQIIFTRRSHQMKYANLFEFIEILFQMSKFSLNLDNNNNKLKKLPDKEAKFKKFMEIYLILPFKKIHTKIASYSIEKIQIFYNLYNNYENPSFLLLIKYDDLIKHVFFIHF